MALGERADLAVRLNLEDEFTAKMDKAFDELDRDIKKIETTAGTAAPQTEKVGTSAAIGAAKGILGFLTLYTAIDAAKNIIGDSIEADREKERSIARLNAVIKGNDDAWDGNMAAIQGVLDAYEDLGFRDEEQRDALAELVQKTGDLDEALRLLPVAMDLAATKGVPLSKAVGDLLKIMDGNKDVLEDYGVELDKSADKQDGLRDVIEKTEDAAEDLAETNDGKLTASEIRVQEAVEKIGPAFSKMGAIVLPILADVATAGADAFAGLIEDTETEIDLLGDLIDKLKELLPGTSQFEILLGAKPWWLEPGATPLIPGDRRSSTEGGFPGGFLAPSSHEGGFGPGGVPEEIGDAVGGALVPTLVSGFDGLRQTIIETSNPDDDSFVETVRLDPSQIDDLRVPWREPFEPVDQLAPSSHEGPDDRWIREETIKGILKELGETEALEAVEREWRRNAEATEEIAQAIDSMPPPRVDVAAPIVRVSVTNYVSSRDLTSTQVTEQIASTGITSVRRITAY